MIYFSVFIQKLKAFPKFMFWIIKDLIRYIKNHLWKEFSGWGLHIYVGKFGSGKTCSMVRDAYNLACKYKGLHIVTNLRACLVSRRAQIAQRIFRQTTANFRRNTVCISRKFA